MDNCSNSRANTCQKSRLHGRDVIVSLKTDVGNHLALNHDNPRIVWPSADDRSIKFLPYQLWMVMYWITMVVTGNGELGFDSGEGA